MLIFISINTNHDIITSGRAAGDREFPYILIGFIYTSIYVIGFPIIFLIFPIGLAYWIDPFYIFVHIPKA